MVARDVRRSAIVGIPLGLVAVVVDWWFVSVSAALIGDAANTLAQPQYPPGPRLMLVAAVMATCAVAIWSRPAAATMAAVAAAFIGYSWLASLDIAPALVPLDGDAGGDGIRDTLQAIVIGGASIPLLLAGGLWLGIALWWLTGREPTTRSPLQLAGLFALGIGVGVAAWAALPVLARAVAITSYQGRDAFSLVPSLIVLALAAGSALLVTHWPTLGWSAAAAAVGFVTYSLIRDDPASGMILVHPFIDWWSIGPMDLEQSIRSAAFRPGTIELAGAWTVMAAAHLLPLRPASRSRPVPHPSPAD